MQQIALTLAIKKSDKYVFTPVVQLGVVETVTQKECNSVAKQFQQGSAIKFVLVGKVRFVGILTVDVGRQNLVTCPQTIQVRLSFRGGCFTGNN